MPGTSTHALQKPLLADCRSTTAHVLPAWRQRRHCRAAFCAASANQTRSRIAIKATGGDGSAPRGMELPPDVQQVISDAQDAIELSAATVIENRHAWPGSAVQLHLLAPPSVWSVRLRKQRLTQGGVGRRLAAHAGAERRGPGAAAASQPPLPASWAQQSAQV